MVTVKVQGKSFDIPQSIEDISLGRFLDWRQTEQGNHLHYIQWLLNTKEHFKDSDTIANELSNCMSIANNVVPDMIDFIASKERTAVPEVLTVLGFDITFKKGLVNDLPYWPYEVCKTILNKELKKEQPDETALLPRVLAHYLYTSISKEQYDEAKAETFVDIVNTIPMKEAIQAGFFFFQKLRDSSNGRGKSFIPFLKKIM